MLRPRCTRTRPSVIGSACLLALAGCADNPVSVTMPGWPSDAVLGVAEATETYGVEGVSVELAYPAFADAPRLTEHLDELLRAEADDFARAVTDAAAISFEWEFAAATEDMVGIRLTGREEEEGGEGDRLVRTYRTAWYDVTDGRPVRPTELLADYGALVELSRIAAEELRTDEPSGQDLRPEGILPIVGVFDSIGFSVLGDLVVEFDDGLAADRDAGRAYAVVPEERAAVLLSDLGRRAQQAAMVRPEGVELPEEPGQGPQDDDAVPAAVPGVFSARDNAVDCAAAAQDCLAVSFDGGPGERVGDVLDELAEHNAAATFFVTGELAELRPEAVRRIHAEGHELGNHTWSQTDLTELSADEALAELQAVQALMRRHTGLTPEIMRPPFGRSDTSVLEAAEEAGLAEVLPTVDVRDWEVEDAEEIAQRAEGVAEPDAIMALHDIHAPSIDALPQILQALDDQGFTLVTVGQLLGEVEPGGSYGT